MALRSFAAGDNILVGKTKATRNLRDAGKTWYNATEVVETEDREWVALTQAAAAGAVTDTSGQDSMTLSGAGTTYEHSSQEQNRTIKSFIYRCSANKKSISFNEPPA